MYNFDELVKDKGNKEKLEELINEHGYGQNDLLEYLGIKTSSRITAQNLLKHFNLKIKYTASSKESRKWMVLWDRCGNEYWNNTFLKETLLFRLKNPIINKTKSSIRGRVSAWGHPRANTKSHQIAAHEILWEIHNECYLPEGYEVYPLDGNFLNLTIENFKIRTSISRKSLYASGEKNYFYTGTQRYVNYTRGWNRISKQKRLINPVCELCNKNSENSVNVHHIISYWLFDENDLRVHSDINLLSLCDSCHGKVHQQNINLTPLLSVTRCNELLELLESLKSQVSESLMETYLDVEKQLGLTGNQQRSS